jgi:hypothetical protein
MMSGVGRMEEGGWAWAASSSASPAMSSAGKDAMVFGLCLSGALWRRRTVSPGVHLPRRTRNFSHTHACPARFSQESIYPTASESLGALDSPTLTEDRHRDRERRQRRRVRHHQGALDLPLALENPLSPLSACTCSESSMVAAPLLGARGFVFFLSTTPCFPGQARVLELFKWNSSLRAPWMITIGPEVRGK